MRYVAAEQLRMLLLTVVGLAGVYLSVEALDKLRHFLSQGVDLFTVLEYFALVAPRMVADVAPFALLVATVVALGTLSARSEITAMRAAGVGVLKVVSPLLLVGLLTSLLLGWGSVAFIPHANALAARVLDRAGADGMAVFSRDSIWFKAADDTVFGIRSAAPDGATMWGVRIIQTGPDGRVAHLTQALRMDYADERWTLVNGRRLDAAGDTLRLIPFATAPAPLDRPPASLGDVRVPHAELSSGRLAAYIARLKADGYAALDYEVELARRAAFPFACLVMVLVAIPHGITPPRSHSLSKGIGMSMLIALVFWLLYSLSLALGRAAMLPPEAAAWLPLAVFAAYGANRLLAVRQ